MTKTSTSQRKQIISKTHLRFIESVYLYHAVMLNKVKNLLVSVRFFTSFRMTKHCFIEHSRYILHLLCGIILLFLTSCSDNDHYLYGSLGNDSHKTKFKLEIAQTPDEKQRGLMFRNYLGEDEGMIFIYQPPEKVGIWMKNTYIPLDILFISCDNKIEKIVPNMRPESLDVVYSDTPVCYVIELAGGITRKIGLKKGDIFERD